MPLGQTTPAPHSNSFLLRGAHVLALDEAAVALPSVSAGNAVDADWLDGASARVVRSGKRFDSGSAKVKPAR